MRVIKAIPRIPRVSAKIAGVAVLAFGLVLLVVDEELPEPVPAGAVGVKVACALERQDVAAAAAAEEAGGLETKVAFPPKLHEVGLRLVIS